jgi:hypothetical protein
MEMRFLPEDQPPGLESTEQDPTICSDCNLGSPMNSYRFSFGDLTPDARNKVCRSSMQH